LLAPAADAEQAADAVVGTGDDVLADPNFARAVGEIKSPGVHLGALNREGRFRLFSPKSDRGRPLCDVRLSLDDIMASSDAPAVAPLVDRRRTIAPPAINLLRPFPLLLSHQLEVDRAWAVKGHGVFTITRDRRLMHWRDPKEGARQLADDLPEGGLHWASVAPSDVTTRAVIGKLSKRGLYLLSVDLDNGRIDVKRLSLSSDGASSVSSHNGAIFVMTKGRIEAFSFSGGAFVGATQYPPGAFPTKWGRFLWASPADWVYSFHAVSFDGVHIQISSIEGVPPGRRDIPMFDVLGIDGPVGINAQGNIHFFADSTTKRVKHNLTVPIKTVALSRDGQRVVLESVIEGRIGARKLVDVVTQSVYPVVSSPQFAVEAEGLRIIRARMLRHRFDAIAVLRDQTLALRSRRGVWFKIDIDMIGLKSIMLLPAKLEDWRPIARPFDRDCSDSKVGYTLRAAVWPEGSLAFLDSRGLLHLRSADPAVPEITLVLTDGPMSGWVGDGRRFGLRYFTGSDDPAPAYSIFHEILEPFTARLPC